MKQTTSNMIILAGIGRHEDIYYESLKKKVGEIYANKTKY